MTQEVKVVAQITMEVDCTRQKDDIKSYIQKTLDAIPDSDYYAKSAPAVVISIKEESEPYAETIGGEYEGLRAATEELLHQSINVWQKASNHEKLPFEDCNNLLAAITKVQMILNKF